MSESAFELLISDIGMPKVNGYELMRQIRALKSPLANIKAIALSAYVAEFDQQQAKEAGFQQHIAKPLNVDALVATVSKLINQSQPNLKH